MATWHPDVMALIEPAKELSGVLPDEDGLEIWALLGSMTQAGVLDRSKAASSLHEYYQFDETVPAFPVIGRCLFELAASELPGRHLAAASLVALMSAARKRGVHRELLSKGYLDARLDEWNDDKQRPYRWAIRQRAGQETRPSGYRELCMEEDLWDYAEENERALSGVPSQADALHSFAKHFVKY